MAAEPQDSVLLIGGVNTEGIQSTLSTAGVRYKLKLLDSTPQNWGKINELFKTSKLTCALVKFTGHDFRRFSKYEYEPERDELFANIATNRHMVFLHNSLLSEERTEVATEEQLEPEMFPDSSPFYDPSNEERSKAHALFSKFHLNLVGYERNAEMTVIGTNFITDSQSGLLFRLYVPSGRIWANEIDRMLNLFREYLNKIGHKNVRLDQQRTGNGSVYCFYNRTDELASAKQAVAAEFENFTTLLDLCVNDPTAAEKMLKDREIQPNEITEILLRFRKEARRLQLDLKQDREKRLLAIRQQLESELIDANLDQGVVEALADQIVPKLDSFGSVTSATPTLAVPRGEKGGLTINVNSTIIEAVNAVVAKHIEGNVHLGPEDQQILQLIHQYGGHDTAELLSSLHELADKSAAKSNRLIAKQKLTTFLQKIAGKVQDVGIGLLIAYLSKLFGLV